MQRGYSAAPIAPPPVAAPVPSFEVAAPITSPMTSDPMTSAPIPSAPVAPDPSEEYTYAEENAVAPEEYEVKNLLQQVKDAGVAGAIAYAGWELIFWAVSVPVCLGAYFAATGHFPDFNDQEDLTKLGAEAFAFVNIARFAVPLRIGLALGSVPFVQRQILDRFFPNRGEGEEGDDYER